VLLAQNADSDASKSGYTSHSSLEGAGGVMTELAEDDAKVDAVFTPPLLDGAFQPWYAMKREWNKKYGLQLGLSYNALYQEANETPTGVDESMAERFQLQGSWTLLGRGTKNPGMMTFRVEHREPIGSYIPPSQLGGQFGSANNVGGGFGNYADYLTVTEIAWRQTANDGKVKFGFGKISAVSWYTTHALSSALTGFQNAGLQSSMTKPNVGRGLGAVAAVHLGERYAVLAGMHDANADTQGNPFDTIGDKDFYYSAELRWFPTSFDRGKWDQVRVQIWHIDETSDGAKASGNGITMLGSLLFKDRYMPFVSFGTSDGHATSIKTDAAAGIAFAFNTKHRAARDILALGLNWGKPSDDSLNEQLTVEAFYRFQLYQNLAFTPSVQFISSPTFGAEDDKVWVYGIRGRLTF
jgi:hypothetical protein